jgi:hypothetical protein
MILNQRTVCHLVPWVRFVALSLLLGIGLMTGTMLASSKAHAATTLTVSDCSDDSQLQADVAKANSDNAGDTINFSCSGDIPLFSGSLVIKGSMTLDGSGQSVTLDGQNQTLVLDVINGNLTVNALTIAHGSDFLGGGLDNDGSTVTISNSTFADNSASGSYSSGGGLDNFGGTVTISNSTFADNSASSSYSSGGGLDNFRGTMTISNSTFADNTASNGGGIDNDGGKVTISNSIVANNAGGNCFGGLSDQGYNLESGTDCGFTGTGSLQNSDPQLDPNGLQNNGGHTQTIALLSTSPAIDTIPASNCPATDQRGDSRPDNGESTCDMGAYEFSDPVDNDLGLSNMPTNITTNATSPQGATVTYTPPTVVDEDNPLPPVNCTPASGLTFPIGTTTVTCTVSDSDDSNSPVSASFTVTVNDSDLALTNMPTNITTNATSPQGAVVTYTPPTVVDEDSPLPSASCLPASGSTFVIGTTTVTCTVSDSDDTNSPVSASFTVTVQPVLSVSVNNVTATEGSAFNGVVATGTAYGSSNPLSATITWGDGNSSTVSITPNPDGSYSVSGSHSYAEEGSYALSVSVKDSGSLSTSGNGTATVSDAALTLTHFLAGGTRDRYAALGATFTDADPNGQVSDYTATVTWGDGNTSTVKVYKNPFGKGFVLAGLHRYTRKGSYSVTLTVSDAGGSQMSKTVSVTVK